MKSETILNASINRIVGWRGKHYVSEGGREIPGYPQYKYPAVIPAFNDGAVIMTEEIQRMSFELMKRFCPTMDGDKWRKMHRWNLAMNNGNGFDNPNGDLRRDYINGLDLTAEYAKYDKVRTFQGSFRTATLNGNLITCTPGEDGIDSTKPMPSIETIIAKRWYSIAVNVGDPPFHWRPEWGGIIVFPFILNKPMTFEVEFFAPWDDTVYPDPIQTYL